MKALPAFRLACLLVAAAFAPAARAAMIFRPLAAPPDAAALAAFGNGPVFQHPPLPGEKRLSRDGFLRFLREGRFVNDTKKLPSRSVSADVHASGAAFFNYTSSAPGGGYFWALWNPKQLMIQNQNGEQAWFLLDHPVEVSELPAFSEDPVLPALNTADLGIVINEPFSDVTNGTEIHLRPFTFRRFLERSIYASSLEAMHKRLRALRPAPAVPAAAGAALDRPIFTARGALGLKNGTILFWWLYDERTLVLRDEQGREGVHFIAPSAAR